MAEQVKVFKNVQSQAVAGLSHSDNMFTNAATTRSVVKQISATGLGAGATLEMGGSTVMTSTAEGVMEGSGNLIMDVNNALSLKFPDMGIASLKGMFWSEGSDGIIKIDGDYKTIYAAGSQAAAMTVTQHSNSSHPADDACATRDATTGVITFWRQYNGTLYSYKEDGTQANSNVSFGGNGYNCTTDGVTYIYSLRAGGSTAIDRYNYQTGTVDTITATSTMYGPQANQGAFGLYYKEGDIEYLLGKEYANTTTVYRLRLDTMAVNTYSHGTFGVGSYSDGAAITTNTAGTVMLVEVGQSYYYTWPLAAATIANAPTRYNESSNSSTEYGNGAAEIAPGIILFFGEENDRITLINVNVGASSPHYYVTSNNHGYSVDYSYGNRFAFATMPILAETRSYDVRISGVEITEDS